VYACDIIQSIESKNYKNLSYSCKKYYNCVQLLNENYIFQYNSALENYQFYKFFYHNFKFAPDVNTLREFHNYIYKNYSELDKLAIEYVPRFSNNLLFSANNPFLPKSIRPTTFDITKTKKFVPNETTSKWLKRQVKFPVLLGTIFLAIYGANSIYSNKKKQAIIPHPDREEAINMLTKCILFNPSKQNVTDLWSLMSTTSKWNTKDLKKVRQRLEESQQSDSTLPIDYFFAMFMYYYLINTLIKVLSDLFNRQYPKLTKAEEKKMKDEIDLANDTISNVAANVRQSAATIAATAVVTAVAPQVGLAKFGGIFLKMASFTPKISTIGAMIGTLYNSNFFQIITNASSFTWILNMVPIFSYLSSGAIYLIVSLITMMLYHGVGVIMKLINPISAIQMIAEVFAHVRRNSSKIYNFLFMNEPISTDDTGAYDELNEISKQVIDKLSPKQARDDNDKSKKQSKETPKTKENKTKENKTNSNSENDIDDIKTNDSKKDSTRSSTRRSTKSSTRRSTRSSTRRT
jgi:hypothetical protein